MIIVVGILLGLLLGAVSGGRLSNLASKRLRGEALLLLALAVQVGHSLVPLSGIGKNWALVLWLSTSCVISVVAIVNLRSVGMSAVLFGSLLNFTVVALNRGMPVSEAAMVAGGFEGDAVAHLDSLRTVHVLLNDQTVLGLMSDVMPLPNIPLIRGAVSLGDVLLVVGVIAYVVAGMRKECGAARSTRATMQSNPS